MARIRTVKPEFFHHEGLAGCSPHARLLAIALLQLCDREGRMRWLAMQVHGHAFPHEPGLDVSAMASELEAIGYLVRYEVDGKWYAEVPGFRAHQVITGNENRNRLQAPPRPESSMIPSGRPLAGQQASSGRTLASTEQGTGNREQGTIERAREDDEPDFDGWSAEGQMLDAILSWAGVPSLAPSKPRKKLQRLARWLVANGGWDEPNFAGKRAWLDEQPHRPGMDKLKHLLNLVNDDGTLKPRKGSPAAIKDEAAALAAAGVASWDAWWRDPSWRGGQSVWALVRTRLRAGEDLDAVWASSCERFQAPHAVAWIQQARERATREELL